MGADISNLPFVGTFELFTSTQSSHDDQVPISILINHCMNYVSDSAMFFGTFHSHETTIMIFPGTHAYSSATFQDA
jgi:hypothetical protein